MLLNLRSEYASGYNLFRAIRRYSESEVLRAFSYEGAYRSAVKKFAAENNFRELLVLKNEIDQTCDLITAETSRNLKSLRENLENYKRSHGIMEGRIFCKIYPLERLIAYNSFHQAVLMRESLRLQKMIDRIRTCCNQQEYKRLSSEIDLLESEATSYELLGTLNELRYHTGCFQI